MKRRLSDQHKGFSGLIQELVGHEIHVERLQELGFIPGESVQIHECSPLAGPIFVQVQDAVIALRREEAACILL